MTINRSRRKFFTGFSRAFNLNPKRKSYPVETTTVEESLYEYWKTAGNSLRSAMSSFDEQEEKQPTKK